MVFLRPPYDVPMRFVAEVGQCCRLFAITVTIGRDSLPFEERHNQQIIIQHPVQTETVTTVKYICLLPMLNKMSLGFLRPFYQRRTRPKTQDSQNYGLRVGRPQRAGVPP